MSTTTTLPTLTWVPARDGGSVATSPLGRTYWVQRRRGWRGFTAFAAGFPENIPLGSYRTARAAQAACGRFEVNARMFGDRLMGAVRR